MREMGDETRIVRRLGGQVGSVLLTGEEWCLLGSRAAIRLNQFPARSVQCTAPEAYAFAPNCELGISSTMLHTSLSAKKSLPVNCSSFRAPCTSKKNGSLLQPAKKR